MDEDSFSLSRSIDVFVARRNKKLKEKYRNRCGLSIVSLVAFARALSHTLTRSSAHGHEDAETSVADTVGAANIVRQSIFSLLFGCRVCSFSIRSSFLLLLRSFHVRQFGFVRIENVRPAKRRPLLAFRKSVLRSRRFSRRLQTSPNHRKISRQSEIARETK